MSRSRLREQAIQGVGGHCVGDFQLSRTFMVVNPEFGTHRELPGALKAFNLKTFPGRTAEDFGILIFSLLSYAAGFSKKWPETGSSIPS